MHGSIKIASLAAAFALVTAGPVAASDAGNAENGKTIYMNGKGEVAACMTCHGDAGMGDDNMGTPRLAGQGYAFVVKQLQDFADDKRQDQTMFIMNFNAKGLSEQDRKDVAAYVSSLDGGIGGSNLQEVADNGLAPVGVRYLGKSLAQFGAPDRGIPACHSCHGYNARGAFPVYPRLAGQRYIYLVNQLKHWRDGSRANDPLSQMQVVAQKMTDDDIHNVATFLTNAPLTTMGNSRVPGEH